MRLRKFRLWMLMVGVAVAGVLIFGKIMRERSADYQRRAVHHAYAEKEFIRRVTASESIIQSFKNAISKGTITMDKRIGPPYNATVETIFRNQRRQAAYTRAELIPYHSAMRRKYDRAARYPWLPVAPEHPEPPEVAPK